MATHVGLWIDHRSAVIVTVTGKTDTTQHVESNAERHAVASAGEKMSRAHESHAGMSEDGQERRFHGQLEHYYDAVVACIRDADEILIMGPGEAKGELRACLEKHGFGDRVVGVETADRMTDHQVAARVREQLGK
jgi:stalled ribosome rescue protein Dom34